MSVIWDLHVSITIGRISKYVIHVLRKTLHEIVSEKST